MRVILIGLALALVAAPAWAQGQRRAPLVAPAASAQTPQQGGWCSSFTATHDQKIEGCTALIQSGHETTMGLVIAYNMRGVAYAAKGQYDQAIADYTQVIALKPDYALYYMHRGLAYEGKGSRDQAIADFRAALKLDPNFQSPRAELTRLGATP
jgi:tetratricopeptide (TPR) repeat protein